MRREPVPIDTLRGQANSQVCLNETSRGYGSLRSVRREKDVVQTHLVVDDFLNCAVQPEYITGVQITVNEERSEF